MTAKIETVTLSDKMILSIKLDYRHDSPCSSHMTHTSTSRPIEGNSNFGGQNESNMGVSLSPSGRKMGNVFATNKNTMAHDNA